MARKAIENGGMIPLISVVGAAALGLIGNAVVAYINGENTRELEILKLQQQLLLSAVTSDKDQSKKNLEFLIEAKLLKKANGIDPEEIRNALKLGKSLIVHCHTCLLHEYLKGVGAP